MTNINSLLQQCFTLLNQGDHAQVIEISFKNKNRHPSFELLMAVSKGQLGEYEESHGLFEKMREHYPKNPDILYNQGLIFKQQGYVNKAHEMFGLAISIQPNYHQAFHAMGNIERDIQNLESALKSFTTALNILPNNLEYIRSVSKVMLALGLYHECFASMKQLAISTNGTEEDLLIALESLYQVKANDKATPIYEIAIERYPNNSEFLLMAGLIEIDQKRIVLARELLEKAQVKAKGLVSFDIEANLTFCRFILSSDDRELQVLDNLININSSEKDYLFICNLYETLGNVPMALFWVKKALSSFPNSRSVMLLQAKCFLRLTRFDEAESILSQLLENTNGDEIPVIYEQIKLCEVRHDYIGASELMLRANALNLSVEKEEASGAFLQTIKTGKYNILENDHDLLQSVNQQKFIFIVGFPRSGTTLLESNFAKLEDTVVLEETNALRDMYHYLENLAGGKSVSQYLHQSGQEYIDRYADMYLERLKKFIDFKKEDLIIDKMPLNGLYLNVVNQLFPNAQVICIRRDPRDICISCFKQPMVNLHSTEQFIESYNSYFEYLEYIQNKLKINWVNLCYEDLVINFDLEFANLLAKLDVHKNYGVNRARLYNTPSYAQVTQKIYTDAVNRYRHYETTFDFSHLLFNKWIEKLGYQ